MEIFNEIKPKEDAEVKKFVHRSLAEVQRAKLDKLMKNPEKPVLIPESTKRNKEYNAPSFVRNVMGSSAGAGSGEFHVYRHLRRKEYARQKHLKMQSETERLNEEYQDRLDENKRKAEAKTNKKRAKRLKRKMKGKKPKLTGETPEGEEASENSDDSENNEEASDNNEETSETDTKQEKDASALEDINGTTTEDKNGAKSDDDSKEIPELPETKPVEASDILESNGNEPQKPENNPESNTTNAE